MKQDQSRRVALRPSGLTVAALAAIAIGFGQNQQAEAARTDLGDRPALESSTGERAANSGVQLANNGGGGSQSGKAGAQGTSNGTGPAQAGSAGAQQRPSRPRGIRLPSDPRAGIRLPGGSSGSRSSASSHGTLSAPSAGSRGSFSSRGSMGSGGNRAHNRGARASYGSTGKRR